MAEYTITDLPRELTPDEAYRMTEVCRDTFMQFEFEREKPSHVCKKVHAGKTVKTPDIEVVLRQEFPQWPMEIDGGTFPVSLQGVPQFTTTHTNDPICHDCGRGLVRPPGHDALTWLCPNARKRLPAGGPDSAVECGEKH